jgi:hypothetical protein
MIITAISFKMPPPQAPQIFAKSGDPQAARILTPRNIEKPIPFGKTRISTIPRLENSFTKI